MADIRQRAAGRTAGAPSSYEGGGSHSNTDHYHRRHSTKQSGLLCKLAVLCAIGTPLLLLALFVMYNTSKSVPIAFSLPNPPRLEGALKFNSHLQSAERLYEGKIIGPESIVRQNGHMYVGTYDGKILHIHKGEIRTLARFGTPPCGGYDDEPTCGRPLGMRFDSDGYLIVCDAYLGIFKVNVATGDHQLLLPSGVNINGQKLNFLNDLDISSDGFIYFTDTSIYQRRDLFLDMLDGRGTGRLLRYDPLHNTTEILIDHVHFANGVQLSRYGDFLLVAETTRARILKYNLNGIDARQWTVFADNLPCVPDNIRPSSSGGFWIACSVVRYEGNRLNMIDVLSSRPWLRWILSLLPSKWHIRFMQPTSMLVELNSRGDIVRLLMDPNGQRVSFSSEVADDNGILYIGSFREPYIARININRLQADN